MVRLSSRIGRSTSLVAVAFAAGLVACDSDTTAPEENNNDTATVQAMMSDDPSASGQSSAPAGFGRSFEGSFSGTVAAEIFTEADGWIAVGSPAAASFALQSDSATQVSSSAAIPVGTYTRIRFTMTGGSASISAGALLGGNVLAADVQVMMGGSDGEVVIEKEVTPFTVSASSTTSVVLDLNSEAWVTSESTQAQAASDAEIEAATALFVELQ